MSREASKEDRKFMKEFIELYLEKIDLESGKEQGRLTALEKKRLVQLDKSLDSFLLKYEILFGKDVGVLQRIFEKVTKEKKVGLLRKDFHLFLKWVFKRLLEKKIINKEVFDKLSGILLKINLEPIRVWPISGGGG